METNIIGEVNLYKMFMYFFIFGFLGWIAEVIFHALKTGKFINRGFLNGPICPIYGLGMAILILLLNPLTDYWYLLFIVGGIVCSLLELFTGYILDKIFQTKWWDYSKENFNFKGYICLRFSIIWGLGVVLLFYTIVPLVNSVIDVLPFRYFGVIFVSGLMLILIVDLVIVIIELKGVKDNISEVIGIAKVLHGGSDKLGEKVANMTLKNKERAEKLLNKLQSTRIGKAFPKLSSRHESLLEKFNQNTKDNKK